MLRFNKLSLLILCICIAIISLSCSPKEELASVEEVDLSAEINVVEAFGIVKAAESKDLIIDFPATVLEVLVNEGQHLVQNQPIMTLDFSEFNSTIANERKELNIASLEYQRINKSLQGIYLENGDIEVSKLLNDLEHYKNLYNQTLMDHEAKEKLYEVGAISKEEINQSKNDLDEAQIRMDNIEYELESINKNLSQNNIKSSTEKDQLSIQTNRIDQINNNLNILEYKINKPYIIESQIVSEFNNAAIYNIGYGSGHKIDTTKKAFSISNLDSLIVESNVVEEFISDVSMGANVRIVPIAHRSKEYKGKVIYISQMAFANNGETVIPIRVSIDNIDKFLMPNYNVDVYIDINEKK